MSVVNTVKEIQDALFALFIPEKAAFFPKFFKTGKGEYGEGDLFLGVSVPDQRTVAKEYYAQISYDDLSALLSSEYHEHRLTALLMLVLKFEKTKNPSVKDKIAEFYLEHLSISITGTWLTPVATRFWDGMRLKIRKKTY